MNIKRLFLTIVAIVIAAAGVQAAEVEIDGIRYDAVTRAKVAKVIQKNPQYTGDVVISASIVVEGVECAVTTIGNEAFFGCSGLTSVTIPSSVTTIGDEAFEGCTGLTSVTIPSSVTIIGNYAFQYCWGLTSVTIPSSVTSIGWYAFEGCWGLTSVTIPSSVTSIGWYAFNGCTGLISMTIPSSVTTLGVAAFNNCTGLTSVTINEGVTTIGGSAFAGCTGLTSVTIPSSVTYIGEGAFYECTGLTSVAIHEGVTTIGEEAFGGCTELADVYCYAETLPWATSNAFDGSYIEFSTLHVPASAIEKYRTTEPWSGFGTIVAIDGDEPVVPEPEQCEKPMIHYKNGRLTFTSATEGAQFVSEITDADVKKNFTAEVDLSVTYTITAYATKEGYRNSETARATLCWIEVEPQKEGIAEDDADAVTQVKAVPVMIQAEGGALRIDGAQAGTPIGVYDLSGKLIGNTTAAENSTTVCVPINEKVMVVKVGNKAVKVKK